MLAIGVKTCAASQSTHLHHVSGAVQDAPRQYVITACGLSAGDSQDAKYAVARAT